MPGGLGLAGWLWGAYLAHDHSGGVKGKALGGAVPAGAVMVWTGAASTIPAGWARMAETDGRFLRGGDATTHGAAGGADAYDTTHAHGVGSLVTDAGGAHAHTFTTGVNVWGSHGSSAGGTPVSVYAHAHGGGTPSGGAAAHGLTGAMASAGGAVDHKPPHIHYYFIYKM